MMNMLLQAKDLYWEHRDAVRIGCAVGGVVLTQLVLVLWMLRRLGELSHMRERMSRLADGLALLTDTTESGLSTLLREVQAGRKSARASSRATVSKRVTAAARKGEDIAEIAMQEDLSESEVRLHLQLAEALRRGNAAAAGRRSAAV
jgi:hypothetical protein